MTSVWNNSNFVFTYNLKVKALRIKLKDYQWVPQKVKVIVHKAMLLNKNPLKMKKVHKISQINRNKKSKKVWMWNLEAFKS